MQNQFNFFDPQTENYQALLDFGTLPWWLSDNAKLHFFRPLATLTHYFDYQLWPDNTHMMHAMNMLWYILGLFMIFLCYRQFGINRAVALFALLLVILDISIFHVISWIASRSMLMVISIGFFCLYAYDRGVDSARWYCLSFISLALTLLSAEGAVGICTYLAAYVLAFDQRPWIKRFLAILPFAALTLVWRWLYVKAGFGSSGLDFYIDPSHDLTGFINRAIWLYPGNYFELFSGIDILSGQISNPIRQNFAWAGLGLLAINIWLFWQPLKDNKAFRFFFVASIFSLIPSLTIALSPRTMILPYIAFAIVIAFVFYYLFTGYFTGLKKKLVWVMVAFHGMMHLLLAFTVSAYMTVSLIAADTMDRGNETLPYDLEDKHVVFLNSERPFWLIFLGHELARQQKPLPDSIRILSSAFYPTTITRLSNNVISMTADPGFQFDAKPLTQQTFSGHYAYLTMHLMGLLRNKNELWQTGRARQFDDMAIYVDALFEGKPKTLRIEWYPDKNKPYLWLYWNKDNKAYALFEMPKVGQQVQLPGVFEQ